MKPSCGSLQVENLTDASDPRAGAWPGHHPTQSGDIAHRWGVPPSAGETDLEALLPDRWGANHLGVLSHRVGIAHRPLASIGGPCPPDLTSSSNAQQGESTPYR